ncbi:hypothetical protein CHARACLAT_024078 [Characodon lateralis]|uniref:Uncharacterized protein n=1 Tax=Characodon lateralis TaxID=208331 RepID=A0ABU7DN68_9TELE|nr:hypothetical protein [Characodon lateralis]
MWRGGLVYKGTDKRSFDDVTSFILRRHQINLCLSLLTIYGPSSSSSACSSPSTSPQKEVCFSTACKWTGWKNYHLTWGVHLALLRQNSRKTALLSQ